MSCSACVGHLDSVQGQTKRGLDTWSKGLSVAEAQDTRVVDLGLDKGGIVEVRLCSDLQIDLTGGPLGVVGSASTRLNVWVDSVVVACRVIGQVAQGVQSDGIFWSMKASSKVVLGQLSILDVVGSLCTQQEAIATKDSVGRDRGSLQ